MRLINPQSPIGRLRRSDWLVLAALIAVQIIVSMVSTLEKGLAVVVSLGVFAAVVKTKWSTNRRDPRMWALIGVVASVQLPVLFLVHIPRLSTGLVLAPFAVVEGVGLVALLNSIERRFPRSIPPAQGAGNG
jgi:hypothetical protein